MEPFLKTYQTDNPMFPYLYFDLKAMIKQLLELIVERNVIDSCRSGRKLKEINLDDKKNWLSLEKMNFGFAVEHLLKKMKKSDVITISQINGFKREAQKLIRSMLTKLFERSPLGSPILKSAAIFDPAKLRELPKEKIRDRWKMLLKCFIDLGILSPQQCDTATTQFKYFLDEKLKMFCADFDGFLRDRFRMSFTSHVLESRSMTRCFLS